MLILSQQMKTTMKRLLIYICFIMCTMNTLSAKEYRWIHDLAFEAPKDSRVAYNSRTRLEMVWHDMTFIIQLLRTNDVNDDLLKRDLQRTASSYNMYDTRTEKFSNGSFKGFRLIGTLPDGSTAGIYNLLSKKSTLGVQVIVNYTRDSEKEAKKLIKSLKIEKKEPKRPKAKQKIQKKNATPKPIKKSRTSPTELYEI